MIDRHAVLVQSLGQNIPADATDDQIKAQLAGQPLPDAKCCATAGKFITGVSHPPYVMAPKESVS